MTLGTAKKIVRWWALVIVPMAVFAVLYAAPVAQLLRSSLDGFDPIKGVIPEFSFKFYTKFLSDPFYLGVLLRTVRLSLTITVLCAVLCYPFSYYIARSEGKMRSLAIVMLVIPLVSSPVVVAYGWLILLGRQGIINDVVLYTGLVNSPVKLIYREGTLVTGLVYANAAFMVFAVSASIRAIDWNLVLAARSLGASSRKSFLLVVLPLSLPGIIAGSLLVFSLSMAAYAVPALVAGPQVKVMSTLIYQQSMALLNWPFAASMSVMLAVCTTGVLAVWNSSQRLYGTVRARARMEAVKRNAA